MAVAPGDYRLGRQEKWSLAFHGRRILITGHTGFKGAWLSYWLRGMGAKVAGLSLQPDAAQQPLFDMISATEPFEASVYGTVTDSQTVIESFESFEPEIVFHLAAQPLVRWSYKEPVETFAVNVMGTVNILDAVRLVETPVVVCVTTDKCYENTEQIWPYREVDRMGGWDPYSASKGAAEIAISSYRRSFFSSNGSVACASARAGNVVGGGDLSVDRLLPDLFRAMTDGSTLELRNPTSTRPWQHVLESLSGYLTLAAELWQSGTAAAGGWNFGPDPSERVSVGQFVDLMNQELGDAAPETVMGSGGPHEAGMLSLDITKAATQLGWRPALTIGERVRLTADWFRADALGRLSTEVLDQQIGWFESRWFGP